MAKTMLEQAQATLERATARRAKAQARIDGTNDKPGLQAKVETAQNRLDEAKVAVQAEDAAVAQAQRVIDAINNLDADVPAAQTVEPDGIESDEHVNAI